MAKLQQKRGLSMTMNFIGDCMFQYGAYHYDNDRSKDENGYGFIWRDDEDNLRLRRAQARIPTAGHLFHLRSLASKGRMVCIN